MVKFSILIIGILVLAVGIVGAVGSITATQNLTVMVVGALHEIFVTSPVDGTIYTSRVVWVNVSTGADIVGYIKYRDNDKNSEVTLCRNCNASSKRKPFDEGFHDVLFSAAMPEGLIYKHVKFWVDSKVPVIKKVGPRKGFWFEDYMIQFYEVNPKQVLLAYGNNITGYRTEEVNISLCTVKRDTWTCNGNVSLADYDLEKVDYWFSVYDIASHSALSKIKTLDVDSSSPIIEDLNYSLDGREVSFAIDIDELNFKVASYKDSLIKKPKEIVLCRGLKDGKCLSNKRFANGNHSLLLTVRDKAGNSANETIFFVV